MRLTPEVSKTPTGYALDPNRLPTNVAIEEGNTITFTCAAAGGGSGQHSVQWTEYASRPDGGSPISDNENIGSHPEAERYTILHRDPLEYSLQIRDIRISDGGFYECMEAQASVVEKRTHVASLTVVARLPNCTSTIRDSGTVIDLSHNTNDCILTYKGGIIPNMTWTGVGSFNQAQVATSTEVWCGMAFNVSRDMDTRAHQALIHFTNYFHPVPVNIADNVPVYTNVYQSRQMFVYWGPTNMAITPVKAEYDPGDVLTATADAFPPALYAWQNMRTNELYTGSTITVPENWRGFNTTMRCEAQNTIEGTIYPNNQFQAIYVAPITTPTTTTPTTTTTPPPAVAPCTDLSGPWLSEYPTRASLCVLLNLTSNAMLTGMLKNGTDTYWVDIVGRSQLEKFDQVGFNGIWPLNIGVSSFVGECHRCFGEEQLLVNVVSKNKGSPCGYEGNIQYTTQYTFKRATGTLSCPNIPTF